MAPGGGVCKEVAESYPKYAKYDAQTTNLEKNNAPNKTAVSHRMPLTNGVHELLECPVCISFMYPPIFQVCFYFKLPLNLFLTTIVQYR